LYMYADIAPLQFCLRCFPVCVLLSNDRWMGVNMTHVLMSEHNACAGEGSCPCQTRDGNLGTGI
jgi:hypothetical protein